jgi:hypothetical protein
LPGFGDPALGHQAGHHLRYLVAALVQQRDHLLGELRRGLQQPRSLARLVRTADLDAWKRRRILLGTAVLISLTPSGTRGSAKSWIGRLSWASDTPKAAVQ